MIEWSSDVVIKGSSDPSSDLVIKGSSNQVSSDRVIKGSSNRVLNDLVDVWRGVWRCTHAKLAPLTPHPLARDCHYGPALGLKWSGIKRSSNQGIKRSSIKWSSNQGIKW